MSKHTPGPWVAVRNTAYWEIGTEIDGYYAPRIGDVCATDPNHPDAGKQEANANRIVACVNACAGMADPANEIAALKAQRDELLAACKIAEGAFGALAEVNNLPSGWHESVVVPLRAAIAKAEGGAA